MALYFLGKTTFTGSEETIINGRSVYEYYDQLVKILTKHCPEIYLAEPTITRNHSKTDHSSISWYVDTKTEPVLPSEAQQEFVKTKIADVITVLSQHYSPDSTEYLLFRAAFHVQDHQDILIADKQVVLKGWGLDSKNAGLSLFPVSPAAQDNQSIQDSVSLHPNLEPDNIKVSENKTIPSMVVGHSNSPKGASSFMLGMPLLFIRLPTAILFFIIGLLLGWRLIYAERPTKIAKIPVVEAQELMRKKPEIEKQNKVLEEELKKLEEQLKTPPCDLDKSRAVPELNKSLDHSSAPMKSDGKNFQGSLPELLEKSTVFILVKTKDEDGSDAIASGSGFFITPDLIVTNRHVVENAENNTVLVTNKSLGQLKRAHIISISDHSNDVNSFDLAVLKIADAPPQQPLVFTLEAQPLQTVVAAGYPGIIIRQDGALKRLAQGDIRAIPGVVLTKGEVNAIQANTNGEKIIPHSASVSPGNSGGELVDLCGRVVGINTFVTMDQDTSSHSNYAQKSDSIVRALQRANIPIQVQSGVCKDGVVPSANNGNHEENQPVTPAKKSDQSSTPHGDKP